MAREAFVQELVDSYDNWPAERKTEGAGGAAHMESELYPYDRLFSPIRINKTTIKNRIVMAPMGNIDMCDETGRPNDMMLQYFFARAKGGAGLLTTGLVPVSHGIDATVTEKGKLSYFPRIDRSRTVYCAWRDLAQGVHAYGSRIFIQLTAGLGRVGNPQCLTMQGKMPSSGSWLPNYYIPAIPCMRLSDHSLKKIVKNMGQAAADAHTMGIDGVYLHGHEGYLMEQLANPAFNHRKMGHYSDWRTFGLDCVKEIRSRVGPDYPIMYRIDLSLALEETYDDETIDSSHLKRLRGGRTVEQTLEYIEDLVRAGVDIVDVDLGCYDNWWMPHPPASMPAGCFLPVARAVRERLSKDGVVSNAGVPVPVVAVGKLGYPDVAEQALRDGDCDMVMLGRPLLADPDWPNKAYAGRVDDIRPCIGCQEGCVNEFVEAGHPQCAVNPRTSFESQMPETPPAAEPPKRVAVVGAGPGGTVCALVAAQRGHHVTLFERGREVGGRMLAGSSAKIKFDVGNYRTYLAHQVDKAVETGRMEFLPNTEVTSEFLAEQGFDVVVCAAGTKDAVPPVEGLDEALVRGRAVQASELLEKPELLGDAKNVVVIGGGAVGCECAQWLAYEHDAQVSVIEMLPYMMQGACTANRTHLLHALKARGAKLYNLSRATSVSFGEGEGAPLTVTFTRNHDKNVPDPYVMWTPVLPENVVNPLAPKIGEDLREEQLACDLVVLAAGGRPDDALFYELQAAHAAPELHNIGDSFAPGRVLETVRAGYRLGASL